MSDLFPVHLPIERAYTRKMLFAAEIVDAVTLEPVIRDIAVKATGLMNDPVINYDGFFVWFEEKGNLPQQVIIDAGATQYESVTVAAPLLPARSVRIELTPKYGYPFPSGVTVLRGTLLESLAGSPTPVAGAELWLQWIDDTAAGTNFIDAPTRSHSAANGDFAALLRLTPSQAPRLNASGALRARLSARRGGAPRFSSEFTLRAGGVTDGLPPFAWSDLVP